MASTSPANGASAACTQWLRLLPTSTVRAGVRIAGAKREEHSRRKREGATWARRRQGRQMLCKPGPERTQAGARQRRQGAKLCSGALPPGASSSALRATAAAAAAAAAARRCLVIQLLQGRQTRACVEPNPIFLPSSQIIPNIGSYVQAAHCGRGPAARYRP